MYRLSKRTEYAIMAVKHLAVYANGNCITAKEISDKYHISFELLSKILQQLARNNIIVSFQGVKGGYSLLHKPDMISLKDVISAVENDYKLTDCMNSTGFTKDCTHFDCCQIRDPLYKLQLEIEKVFINTTISQII